jgi:NarL family two-component system response regulator LiaR
MEQEKIIRVLVADDHPIVRKGMVTVIDMTEGMHVVGEAKDGLEAVAQAAALQPDVIVMDLVMPRMEGVQAISEICRVNPLARILVLTSFAEDEKIIAAIKAGAAGYMLKDSMPDEVLRAIRDVHNGDAVIQPRIARKLINEIRADLTQPVGAELTPREREVLQWVARGLPNKEIALKASISEATVRSHVRNIFSKLNLTNRSQVVLYAVQNRLVTFD